MNWPIERKLQVGFALALAIVGGISIVSYRNTLKFIATGRRVSHAHEVLTELEATLSTISEGEAAVRGYVLTGDQQFLQSYRAASSCIQGQIYYLRQLTADNPRQKDGIDLLERKLAALRSFDAQLVQAGKTQGAEAAAQRVATRGGKAITDEIRGIISETAREENELLRQGAKAAEQTYLNSVIAVAFLAAMALIYLSGAYWFVRRDAGERKQAEKSIQLYASIVENIQVGVSVWRLENAADVGTFRLVFGNSGAVQASGAPAEKFYGKTMAESLPRLLKTAIPKLMREVVLSGEARDLGEIQYGDELVPEGIFSAKAFPLPGDCVGLAFENITERRRAERVLRDAVRLERRTSEITLLSQLGSMLQTCMTAEEAYSIIVKSCRKLFPVESGAVCMKCPSSNLVDVVAAWGDLPAVEQVFAPDDCWALRSGHAHFVDDARSAVVCRHVNQSAGTEYLCVPMMAQGDLLGVLHIQSNSEGRGRRGGTRERLTVAKQHLAATVAEQIGLALANLRLRETLRMQSIRDTITGLFNRRYMEESLERELRRAARSERPLGAILFDIDNFKRCNDTFGHEAGDCLLRELGNLLQAQVRGEDIACRYGGDEFLLILPDASVEVTEQRAEQLRKEVKRLNAKRGPRISLSQGVAVFPMHGLTAKDILRAADEALYEAKGQGRDQVVVAGAQRQVVLRSSPA